MVRSGNVWHGFVQGLPGSNVRYTCVAPPPHPSASHTPLSRLASDAAMDPLVLCTKQRRGEATNPQHSTADGSAATRHGGAGTVWTGRAVGKQAAAGIP